MLDHLGGAVAVWTDGRVPAPNTVKVSCYQWGMTSAYLCHRHALVPGPIPLPTLVTVFAACSYLSLPLIPGQGRGRIPSQKLLELPGMDWGGYHTRATSANTSDCFNEWCLVVNDSTSEEQYMLQGGAVADSLR